MKGLYKTLEDLVWLTQLGLNLLLPLVLCLGGCWWAVNHWGWPMWVYIPAILLGLAAGAQNFWVFAKEHLKRAQKDKPRRVGFNSCKLQHGEGVSMKLEPESKKELGRIAGGTAICTAAMWVVFAALHTVGWARFDSSVILGSLVGALVAIGNFAGICLVVQKIIDEQDEKRRKAKLQLSYNGRMLLQAVWVVVAIAAPCFQAFASILPLFFPRITIYYLQITGKYKPLKTQQEHVDISVEDDPAPAAAPAADPADKGGET